MAFECFLRHFRCFATIFGSYFIFWLLFCEILSQMVPNGSFWGDFEQFLDVLRATFSVILGSFWDDLATFWCRFGVVLTASWSFLSILWAILWCHSGDFCRITVTQSFRHRAHSGGGLFLAQSWQTPLPQTPSGLTTFCTQIWYMANHSGSKYKR